MAKTRLLCAPVPRPLFLACLVLAACPSGSGGTGAQLSAGFAYVANAGSGDLSAVDLSTHRSAIAAGLSDDGYPLAIAADLARSQLYSLQSMGVVHVYGGSFKLSASVPVGDLPVAMAHQGDRLFVLRGDGFVTPFDLASGVALAQIAVGSGPRSLAVDPVAGRILVANALSNSVTVIDLESGAVVATVTVADAPASIAADPSAGKAYVARSFGGAEAVGPYLGILDSGTGAVLGSIAVGVPYAAVEAVAVDPPRRRLYAIAAYGSPNAARDLLVYDLDSQLVVRTVPQIIYGAAAMAVDPSTGDLFVGDGYANDVAVVSAATGAVARIIVGTTPSAVLILPDPGPADGGQ